jgi:hypothetical protein
VTTPVPRAIPVIALTLALAAALWWLWQVHLSHPVDLTTLTTQQWRDDLHYMARELVKRHANVFHRVSREQYARLVAEIDSSIPKLQPSDIPVHFEKLTAAVGDAHTYLNLPDDQHFYPFGTYYFADDLRVIRVTPAFQDLLGTRLVAINGWDMTQVQTRLNEILTQGENASFYRAHYPWFLSQEVLHALGIVPDATGEARFTFTRDDGTTVTRLMALLALSTNDWVRAYAQAPLFIEHADDDLWYTALPQTHTAYVAFNSYQHLSANASACSTSWITRLPIAS